MAGGERFEIGPDNEDNPQVTVVGYTEKEILLEVRVTYLANIDSVYHCTKANKKWKEHYENRLRNN